MESGHSVFPELFSRFSEPSLWGSSQGHGDKEFLLLARKRQAVHTPKSPSVMFKLGEEIANGSARSQQIFGSRRGMPTLLVF